MKITKQRLKQIIKEEIEDEQRLTRHARKLPSRPGPGRDRRYSGRDSGGNITWEPAVDVSRAEETYKEFGPEGSPGFVEHLEALATAVIDGIARKRRGLPEGEGIPWYHAYDRIHEYSRWSPGAQAMLDVVQPHRAKSDDALQHAQPAGINVPNPDDSLLSPAQQERLRKMLPESRKKTSYNRFTGDYNVKITKSALKQLIKEELNVFNEQEDEMTFPPDEVVVEPGERGHPDNTALADWIRENIEIASAQEDILHSVQTLEREGPRNFEEIARDVVLTSEIIVDSLQELISILRQG